MHGLNSIKLIFAFLLTTSIIACSSGSSSPETSNPIQSETLVTSNNGIVETTINETNFVVSSVDASTSLPVGSIDLVFEKFEEGTLVWAYDPLGRYEPDVKFVPNTTSTNDSLTIQPRASTVSLIFGLLAVVALVDNFHTLIQDPPQMATVKIKGFYNRCITGDADDVLSVIGVGSAMKTLKKVFHVLNAPLNRGITAIQFKFTTPDMAKQTAQDVWKENLMDIINSTSTNGVYCWRINVATNTLLLVADMDEIDSETGFDFTNSFSVNTTMLTGITVYEGDILQFSATGSMYLGFFAGGSGPEGIDYGTGYNYYSNINHGQLVGLIDDNAFAIGAGITFESPWAGSLKLLVNDSDPSNNSGFYQVDIDINRASNR